MHTLDSHYEAYLHSLKGDPSVSIPQVILMRSQARSIQSIYGIDMQQFMEALLQVSVDHRQIKTWLTNIMTHDRHTRICRDLVGDVLDAM